MYPMMKKWAAMIDVNNVCAHQCIYCIKGIRHLRPDHLFQLTVDEIRTALETLADFPGKVGITGGEPLNHPDIEGMFRAVRDIIPRQKAMIFTSSPKHKIYKTLIDETFGEVYINMHDDEQREICLHQPLLLAVGDMVHDLNILNALIDQCWCDRMWSPVVSKKGAFFCDCCVGIDMMLDMEGGWPVEKGWWKRMDTSDQRDRYCHLCGMCLPYEQQPLKDATEKVSAEMYARMKEHRLVRMDDMAIVHGPLSLAEIGRNLKGWQPWRNRQDKPAEGPTYYNV